MNSFNFVFLMSIIMLQMNLGFMQEMDLKVLSDVIVSPKVQNDASDAKDQVENIRKAMNGDGKIPTATVQQLNDTSDARHKIEEAVKRSMYAIGIAVPFNINDKLHAKKDINENKFGFLTLGVPFQDPVVHDKFFDTENRKVLTRNGHIPPTWFNRHRAPTGKNPLVLKEPTSNYVLNFPLWHALLRKSSSGK